MIQIIYIHITNNIKRNTQHLNSISTISQQYLAISQHIETKILKKFTSHLPHWLKKAFVVLVQQQAEQNELVVRCPIAA